MAVDHVPRDLKLVRGIVTTALGIFTVALATYLMLLAGGRLEYVLIAAASATGTASVSAGVRPSILGARHLNQRAHKLTGIGGAILIVEAATVVSVFPSLIAATYAVATIIACTAALWGNYYLLSTVRPIEHLDALR